MEHTLPYCSFAARQERRGTPFLLIYAGACETLCEMELYEQFKQSAQALELLHERKMWNVRNCLSFTARQERRAAPDHPGRKRPPILKESAVLLSSERTYIGIYSVHYAFRTK